MEPGLECLVAPLCQHPGQLAAFTDSWRKPGHLLRVAPVGCTLSQWGQVISSFGVSEVSLLFAGYTRTE